MPLPLRAPQDAKRLKTVALHGPNFFIIYIYLVPECSQARRFL